MEVPKLNRSKSRASSGRTARASLFEQRHRILLFRITLILLVLGFALLTFLVKSTPSFVVDLQITQAIQMIHPPAFDVLMKAISWPGFWPQAVIITILISVALHLMGLRWEGRMIVIAHLLSSGINLLIKNLIQRPRPASSLVTVFREFSTYSFPSGHVMLYLGVFGFAGFLAYSLPKPSWKRSLLLFLFGTFVILIGTSRIYLGAHWASDVLGAYLLGGLVLIAIVQFYLWGRPRFFPAQPTLPGDEPPTT